MHNVDSIVFCSTIIYIWAEFDISLWTEEGMLNALNFIGALSVVHYPVNKNYNLLAEMPQKSLQDLDSLHKFWITAQLQCTV